jgi:methylenetetrahydrofolate--tRNA-(uracil-5-)-methyltransferase
LRVTVIGGGLAGCEAAWQAARRGLDVDLYEMKPVRYSPAHQSPDFAELVCSNSLRSNEASSAVGLLKEEMRRLDSLVIRAADETAVPAGKALAVDRVAFSARITQAIAQHPRIRVHRECVTRLPDTRGGGRVILATGPLTDSDLASELQQLLGEPYLYFYDALSPIVYADSIDYDVAFRASRWQDSGDYLNLPLSRADYHAFVDALLEAETVPLHDFEQALYFEGCLPIEEMARRGRDTLAFGPMKPVGLADPRTGARAHAVVQLRQEDKRGILYSLVGFQTKLRIGEQKRIFRMLPGAEKVAFARFGSIHRNTYLNAPRHLRPDLELAVRPGLSVAGQMAGVEGYVESAALGWVAGVNAAFALRGEDPPLAPPETAHGALLRHLLEADASRFQPMNVNYGLFPPLPPVESKRRRVERNELMAARALEALADYASRTAAPPA